MVVLRGKLTVIGTFLTGVVGLHYIGKVLDYRRELAATKEMELKAMSYEKNMEIVKNKLDILMNNNEVMIKDIEKLLDKQVTELQLLELNKMVDFDVNHCNTVKEILDDFGRLDSLNVHKVAIEYEKANKEVSEAIKNLLDYMDKGSNKLLSNINLEGFYSYLNSLSLVEPFGLLYSIYLFFQLYYYYY